MHDWGGSEILALLFTFIITVLVSLGIVYQRIGAPKWQQMVAAESAGTEQAAVGESTYTLSTRNSCAVCQAPSKSRCSRCKLVRYCSPLCQLQHWNQGHKLACKVLLSNSSATKSIHSNQANAKSINSNQANADMSLKDSLSADIKTSDTNGNANKDIFKKGFIQEIYKKGAETRHCNGSIGISNKEDKHPTHPNDAAEAVLDLAIMANGKISNPRKVLFPYASFMTLFHKDLLGPPCGLINCGNSCFANVVLQCLAYTRPLAAYCLLGPHHQECRRHEWCFMCDLQEHVIRVSRSEDAFSPIRILSRLRKIGNHLGYGRQEDAHEFMRFAIDSMQSIFLDEAGGEKAVDIRSQETTLIQYIFGGHLQSQVRCMQCFQESNMYENMMDLTVEIQGPVESLEGALAQYTAVESLDGDNKYKCDRCAAFVKAKKRLTIHEAPNILTIALKRFQSGKFGKLNKRITFPEQLDMSPYMSGRGDFPPLYQLYAVVVHVDMLNASFFGHYICYVKDMEGVWYKIDDSKVKEVDLDKVMSQNAYMLLYSRSSPRAGPLLEQKVVTSASSNSDQCESNIAPLVEKSPASSEGVPNCCISANPTTTPGDSIIDKSGLTGAIPDKLRNELEVSYHEPASSRSYGLSVVEGKCASLQHMDVDMFTDDSGSLASNSSTSENDMDSSNNSADESSSGFRHVSNQEGIFNLDACNGHRVISLDDSYVSISGNPKQEISDGRPLFRPGFVESPPACRPQKRTACGIACASASGNPLPYLTNELDKDFLTSPLKCQKPVCKGKHTSMVDAHP